MTVNLTLMAWSKKHRALHLSSRNNCTFNKSYKTIYFRFFTQKCSMPNAHCLFNSITTIVEKSKENT